MSHTNLKPEQYALTEAGFVIVKLLQTFDSIQNADPRVGEPLINTNLTMTHENGVHIKLFSSTKGQ